jgi:hypothetical protein
MRARINVVLSPAERRDLARWTTATIIAVFLGIAATLTLPVFQQQEGDAGVARGSVDAHATAQAR